MSLPPLHKHTGCLAWEPRAGRLYVRICLSEDPVRPLPLRCWAQQRADGCEQTDLWFSLVRVRRVFDDGSTSSCIRLNFGPLAVWVGLLPAL